MKLFIHVFILTAVLSCEKDAVDSQKFTNQTYTGIRIIYYQLVDRTAVDTVTVNFDLKRYEYSGTGYMDFGYGTYSINGNTITFIDSLARDAMHTWEWILSGTYSFRSKGDSLYFIENGDVANITFRLKRL